MTCLPLRATLYITRPSLSMEISTFSTAPGEACAATTAADAAPEDMTNSANSATAPLTTTLPPHAIGPRRTFILLLHRRTATARGTMLCIRIHATYSTKAATPTDRNPAASRRHCLQKATTPHGCHVYVGVSAVPVELAGDEKVRLLPPSQVTAPPFFLMNL